MEDFSEIGFEHAPIGLAYTEERIVKRCNARFVEMFGFRRAELEGHSLAKLYPSNEEFDSIGRIGVLKMKGTGKYQDERIMKKRDGTMFWCRVRGQSLDPEAPFAKAVWSFADISESRPVAELTRRERLVVKMMAEGRTSKEIARSLGISHRTVEAHRARLMEKFKAKNSLELVADIAGIPL